MLEDRNTLDAVTMNVSESATMVEQIKCKPTEP